jgi:hypothetical protein
VRGAAGGELEAVLAKLGPPDGTAASGRATGSPHELMVWLENGDDAAVVRMPGDTALILTTDFFTPVVDDAYDRACIAAANALSNVYAMGERPVVAVNLLAWPRDVLPMELAVEVLRAAGRHRPGRAATWPAGTASTTRNPGTGWPSPAPPTRAGCCATTPGVRVPR